jgi:hypothetical protein
MFRVQFDCSTNNKSGGGMTGDMVVHARNAVALAVNAEEGDPSIFARPVP